MTPAMTAVITVLTSGSRELKSDLKRKLVGFYRIKPLSILKAVIGFAVIVVVSILLSLLLGQSFSQFAFTEDFSFSIGGTSALLTILLASVIEEVGWRGYGEDSVAFLFFVVHGVDYLRFCMGIVASAAVLDCGNVSLSTA
jgi:hypothetical protein